MRIHKRAVVSCEDYLCTLCIDFRTLKQLHQLADEKGMHATVHLVNNDACAFVQSIQERSGKSEEALGSMRFVVLKIENCFAMYIA